MTETTNPIMASVVETPKPKRPRLYVAVGSYSSHAGSYVTGYANTDIDKAVINDSEKGDLIFALPGTDDVWTEEKIRKAACQYCFDTHRPMDIDTLVLFATQYLGLGEQT